MAVNLIKNGNFEATRVTKSSAGAHFNTNTGEGYIIDNTPQDWSLVYGSGVDLLNDVHSKFGTSKTPYGQYVELDGRMNTGIAQAVSTSAGKKYLLSFDWALPSYAGNNYSFPDYSSKFDVVVDGKVVFSYDGTYGTRNAWTNQDIFITAGSSNTTIQFLEKGTSDAEGTLLDNITLFGVPVIRGNSLYTIVDGPSWTQAEANSVKLGGHLASIQSKEENEYVQTVAKLNSDPLLTWIGGTDRDEEGAWRWIDGKSWDYVNWSQNEPNNNAWGAGIQENYLAMYKSDGTWNDNFEGNWAEYSTTRGIAEIPFIRRGDSAYVIVQGPTWEEAEANAVKLGGHLVTINDAEENDWIIANYSKEYLTTPWWIGLSDKDLNGTWEWADGSNQAYFNWAIGEPNTNGDYGPNYAQIYINSNVSSTLGKWNDQANWNGWNPDGFPTLGIAEIKLAPNNKPTGTPTLSGNFKAGQVITIDKTSIQDADNFTGYTPEFKYSWEIANDPGMTMMMPNWESLKTADATDGNQTFTITADLTGKLIRGVVSYVDGYGTNESVASTGASPIQPGINLDIGSSSINASKTTTLASTISRLILTGTRNINAIGNALNNYLKGNNGNNILDGGAGNDSLAGGRGNDTYIIDSIYDSIVENINEGIDVIRSSVNWTLGANLENLTLTGTGNLSGTGNGLNNTIIGNSGNNVIDGGSGIDNLDGGLGNDTLIGGLGNDAWLRPLEWCKSRGL